MQEEQFPLPPRKAMSGVTHFTRMPAGGTAYFREDVPLNEAQVIEPRYLVEISNSGGSLVVGIYPDGGVQLGEGVQLQEAALLFWQCVGEAASKGKL